MEFSIYSFFYLFIVLAPFIIICAITLISLFNADFKGICFLAGLAVTSFISGAFGQLAKSVLTLPDQPDAACKATIMTMGGTPYNIPMGQVIISYTFWYFVYCIIINGFVIANIGMIVFFCILILGDIAWNRYNNCFGLQNMIAAMVLGGGMGAASAKVIDTISDRNYLYFFNGIGSGGGGGIDSCSVPSKQTFKCNVTQGGRVLQ
jgi:hypothetical protein